MCELNSSYFTDTDSENDVSDVTNRFGNLQFVAEESEGPEEVDESDQLLVWQNVSIPQGLTNRVTSIRFAENTFNQILIKAEFKTSSFLNTSEYPDVLA